jgi:putative DNA methylase
MTYRKKLIEVALPLEAINVEAAREKSMRHGHPSALHLWWARRPLAACRAVLFSQLVDDPSSHPEEFPTEEAQDKERQRLFRIIEEFVKWENINDERVLESARSEIRKSAGVTLPPVLDPFCGGGSIPLEAQRLGLHAFGSDLNPVAVLITKAQIEIPPRFAGSPPVHPVKDEQLFKNKWYGAQGIAEDVRYYGRWMLDEAKRMIGHLYPKVKLPDRYGSGEATAIAWLWARTIQCPNPACNARAPMVRSFWLSQKKGRSVYANPLIDQKNKTIQFEICTKGVPEKETTNRTAARCLFCNTTIKKAQLRELATQFGMQEVPLAVVCESSTGRVFLPFATDDIPPIARPNMSAIEQPITDDKRWFSPPLYGLPDYADLFTTRQQATLTTFSDLVQIVREKVLTDAITAGMPDDNERLNDGGKGAQAYADAIATYMAFLVDQLANHQSSICGWNSVNTQMRNVFARQAIPMTWDFAESNPFCESSGSFHNLFDRLIKGFVALPATTGGKATQLDATASVNCVQHPVISTDPPYYDNIGYADLSDFFYVWLRRSLSKIYPDLFSTVLVPKSQELVAAPHRFDGSKLKAQQFFEEGLGKAFASIRESQNPEFPFTIFYAFKQSEEDEEVNSITKSNVSAVASTGWETMLEGLVKAGFAITGTWPMRTEKVGRVIGIGTNALASSIVLVCRPRSASAPLATRREFLNALRKELPPALKSLQHGNIAPVDLAQATIGPGMAIYSRYSKVLEADGQPMTVRSALQIINQELDAYLTAQESEMDRETRFCLAWFEQYGVNEGKFGEADVLARAKNTAVQGLVDAGVINSKGGKVRLLKREEYSDGWDPIADKRVTVWECTQHLIQRLNTGGEEAAARLVNKLGGGRSEEARALAYRLFSLCERKKWADEALAYNTLVVSWPAIQDKAAQLSIVPSVQGKFFE